MFVFGQLFLAAIICALPFTWMGVLWYIGVALYLFTSNVLTLYSWQKAKLAYLSAVNTDMSYEGFKVREGMRRGFRNNQPHPRVICMMILYAPITTPVLIFFLVANKFFLKKFISRLKTKSIDTLQGKAGMLWLEDLLHNGLFRSKL